MDIHHFVTDYGKERNALPQDLQSKLDRKLGEAIRYLNIRSSHMDHQEKISVISMFKTASDNDLLQNLSKPNKKTSSEPLLQNMWHGHL